MLYLKRMKSRTSCFVNMSNLRAGVSLHERTCHKGPNVIRKLVTDANKASTALQRLSGTFVLAAFLASCGTLKTSEHGKIAISENVSFANLVEWPAERDISKFIIGAVLAGGVGAAMGAPMPSMIAVQPGSSKSAPASPSLVKFDLLARSWFADELKKASRERLLQQPGLSVAPSSEATAILEIDVKKYGFSDEQLLNGRGVIAFGTVWFGLKDRNGRLLARYSGVYPFPGMIWGSETKDRKVSVEQLASASGTERAIRRLARDLVNTGFHNLAKVWIDDSNGLMTAPYP